MYLEHYGLNEPPFSITPDPRFVFLSERHRDALAHLLFGIGQGGGGGFVQLTGEVGTGKTTLSRLLLEQLPDDTRVALVLNPRLTPVELLETICEELRLDLAGGSPINRSGSVKALVDLLNGYLLEAYAQGLRVVLIVDEAQNLSIEALEQVRLLTNLETDTQKLLQIILLGQPELRDMLARPELRQLAQRITARYHLTPLDAGETDRYLRHRYGVGGGQHFPFTPRAVQRIHAHSGGVPRLTNVVAERALLAGYARDQTLLDERVIDQAAKEALAPATPRLSKRQLLLAAGGIAAIALLVLLLRLQPASAPEAPAPVSTAAMAATAGPVKQAPTPTLDGDAFAQRVRAAGNTPLQASSIGRASPALWQQLLALWQAGDETDAANAAGCALMLAPGLYCVRGRGRLDKLATLGRPALLRLRVDDREAWALLLGADAVQVRLQLDDAAFDTDRVALEQAWNGEYAALWRAPAFLAAPIVAGSSGPAIDWIERRLMQGDDPRTAGPALLDAQMVAAVTHFQRARGLAADGVIGPETLMALAADQDGPRLARVLP